MAPTRASTASRNALPGLKCGTSFSEITTCSPERGLRPTRGGRRLIEKLPKPRISMRWPRARAEAIASRIVLTANSVSRCVSWPKRSASWITRSERVTVSPWPAVPDRARSGVRRVLVVELGAQQGAQARGARVLALAGLRQALHRFLLVGVVLGLDRELDRTRLAVDVDDHGVDFVAFLQHVARVFDAVTADLRGTQVTGDVVLQLDLGTARVDRQYLAGDERAAIVDRAVAREWIGVELLDAERDAFAVDVDRQHDRFHVLALLVVANRGF